MGSLHGENILEVSTVVPFAGICMLLGMAFYYRVKSSESISCLPQSFYISAMEAA